jgi:hypothetical protein
MNGGLPRFLSRNQFGQAFSQYIEALAGNGLVYNGRGGIFAEMK